MPPSAKDFDVAASSSQTPAGPAADTSGKPQPVALEVPVTVNGARTVEGSDKREPFSESTQTVLVFSHGAVIRLASNVTPGQLLFLTNDKTKKEVVCQVVKSKNYRNVSGYVELEFTETVAGFWGMRFAGERVTAQPGAPAPIKSPMAPLTAAPKVEAPVVSNLPKRPESQPLPAAPPARALTVTTSALKTETKPPSQLPRAADPKPATTLPKVPVVPNAFGTSVTTSSPVPESKPAAPAVTKAPPAPPAPVVTPPSMDALKLEYARLQEQFSSMLFTPEVPARTAQPASTTPAVNKPASADSAAKVIEMAQPQPPTAKAIPPAKSTPLGTVPVLDADEVKIPSWLEPLARNAATPAQNEIATRDEAALADRVIEFEVQDVSAPTTTQETGIVTPAEPVLDAASHSEVTSGERVPAKSNKGILIGAIAAGLVVAAAGGTWYMRQSQSAAPSGVASVIPPATSGAAAVQPPAKKAVEAPAASRANLSTAAATLPPVNAPEVSSQTATPTAQPLKTATNKYAAAELLAYKRLAEPPPQPAQPQPKKPSLGEVHLAAPAVNRRPTSSDTADAELAPALGADQVSSTGNALGEGLAAGSTKQPAAPPAPLPVGGDVKQAHLLSSTQPTYPVLAKNQHIQGDVRIDALIDANGHVSAMKVISGPMLLHQAAMDALKEWKYQPATLDGKPVPMHLTVTLQFRLQ
jgi:periplasmic protein TonB